MREEKQIEIPADEMGMSGYSKLAWKMWNETKLPMAFCVWIDPIVRSEGYRKQREGEWQKAPDGTHWCSECGHDATYTFDGTEICGVACPFCGAKMKNVNP
jgi:hypothetical protein